jgi:hypothetical protein
MCKWEVKHLQFDSFNIVLIASQEKHENDIIGRTRLQVAHQSYVTMRLTESIWRQMDSSLV